MSSMSTKRLTLHRNGQSSERPQLSSEQRMRALDATSFGEPHIKGHSKSPSTHLSTVKYPIIYVIAISEMTSQTPLVPLRTDAHTAAAMHSRCCPVAGPCQRDILHCIYAYVKNTFTTDFTSLGRPRFPRAIASTLPQL